MQQHIKLTAFHTFSDHAAPHLVPERGICAASFDASGGHFVDCGPAVEHLSDNDAEAFCFFLIDQALALLHFEQPPTYGVLLIQAESATQLSAFYMPDASVKLIDSPSAAIH